jgi:hypothetical protein
MYNQGSGFIPCDQNVDVSTLDQVYTRFNMHVWKLSTVSPYYTYYFNPSTAPCTPTGVITDSRANLGHSFYALGYYQGGSQFFGQCGTALYYNRELGDEELVDIYRRHMVKYLLPDPFIPVRPTPNGYVFTRSGMYTVPTGVVNLKVLVIGGGGGGGAGWEGGGGGAGGFVYQGFYQVTPGQAIQVIIGRGGRGGRRNCLPESGGDTIFGTLIAYGGGAGGTEQNTASIGPNSTDPLNGGSGGGGSWGTPTGPTYYGKGTSGQGNNGGQGYNGAPYVGGGGGGAGSVGSDASSYAAGNGGNGRTISILGVTKTYCGGGGGSLRGSGTSSGGSGGGGGGNGAGSGANATYYGSGGGAGGGNGTVCFGGDGFQGIVLVEINTDPYPVPIIQNPGNQVFSYGGTFYVNQIVSGLPYLTWSLIPNYVAPSLVNPGNQTFGTTGSVTVTNSVNSVLVGPLTWTISLSSGVVLQTSNSVSASYYFYNSLSSTPVTVTATGSGGSSSATFNVTCTGIPAPVFNSLSGAATLVCVYSLRSLRSSFAKVAQIVSNNTPVMTSSTTASFVASASSEYPSGTEYAYSAFDKNLTGSWWTTSAGFYNGGTGAYTGSFSTVISGTAYSGEWLQIQYPYAATVTSYTLYYAASWTYRTPATFKVAGSNDGSTWTVVDTQTSVSWGASSSLTFTPSSPGSYTYYRLCVNARTVGATDNYLSIGEWVLTTTQDFYADTAGNLNTSSGFNGAFISSWLNSQPANVATLYDQSTNGYNLTQSTAALRPGLNISTTPYSMVFGGSIYLVNSALVYNMGTSPFTLRYVISNNTGGCVLFKAIGTAFTWSTPYEKKFWMGDGTTNETSQGAYPSQVGNSENYVTSSSAITGGGVKNSIVHKKVSGTSVPIYINTVAATISSGINMQSDAGNYLIIGRGGNASAYTGNIFELELFSATLSDADRLILEN